MKGLLRKSAAIALAALLLVQQLPVLPAARASEGAPTGQAAEGTAYAVLTDAGELVLLRSNEHHTDGPGQSVTDVTGRAWEGEVYTGVEAPSYSKPADVPWSGRAGEVASFRVAPGSTIRPSSCAWLLSGLESMTSCDLTGLDTSGATSMRGMFYACELLGALDASPLDTSAVTDMAGMFARCRSLESLDLTGFDVSHVTTMGELTFEEADRTACGMFCYCHKLSDLDIRGWDTSSVTDMSGMFCQAMSLDPPPVEHLDTSHVTDMSFMFAVNYCLKSLDVSCMDTSSLRHAHHMFNGMTALERLDISSFDTSRVDDMTGFIAAAKRVGEVKLGPLFSFKGTDGESSFTLPDPPASDPYDGTWCRNWDKATAMTAADLRDAYDGATMAGTWSWTGHEGEAYAVLSPDDRSLTLIRSREEVADGPGQTITDIRGNAWEGTVYGGIEDLEPASAVDVPWHDAFGGETSPVAFRVAEGCPVRPKSCAYWLCGDSALETAELEGLDTSATTSLAHMFDGCSSLKELDLGPLDTSAASDLSHMLSGCSGLASLDASGIETAAARSMSGMFASCDSLERLDLSSFDTGATATADGMFDGCRSLGEVTLGEAFSFTPGDTARNTLPDAPSDDGHTGKWARTDGTGLPLSAEELASSYAGETMAGTWAWEESRECALTLELAGGTAPEGQTYPTTYRTGAALPLPGSDGSALGAPTRPGHAFCGWADESGEAATCVEADSRGGRTMTATWTEHQIHVRVPVAATLAASPQADGTIALEPTEGDFTLSVTSLSTAPVSVTARATAAEGFALSDDGAELGDAEADVWLTPVTCGSDPTAEGYDASEDEGYREHGRILLSGMSHDTKVGPDLEPRQTMWLNKVGGRMGGWSSNDGSKSALAQISWTFALASGE